MFHIHLCIVCIFLVRNGTLLNPLVPISQAIIQVGLFTIIIPNAWASRAEILNDFGISCLCQFGIFVYVS